MAPAPSNERRISFFPKTDAAVLSSKHQHSPTPQTVGPILDPENVDRPIGPWSTDVEVSFYPPKAEAYAPATIKDRPTSFADRYLRPFLAKNERLRLSMLWYYTRDILKEGEFLSGLQEKANSAQESTGWEFAVIGILDVNVYIRLATVGLSLAILPRGETICAHTITQPPGSVFLLPDLMEDWRFQKSPYLELGGLRAYAGVPLRLQNESGDCVGLGSLCVAASTSQEPLTKPQQQTLVRLADWVVSDIVQCARARRQRERRRMSELASIAQGELDNAASEEPVLRILRTTYPNAMVNLQSSTDAHVEIEGRGPILTFDLVDGLWEDIDFLDDLITNSNHQDLPSSRVVRVLAAQCESISGSSLLVVGSKDFHMVFDDVDSWFVQTCAGMLSQMWHRRLLAGAMIAKEKFLRGISHQLRTPIHGILGSVELLAEELQSRNLAESTYPVSALGEVTPAVGPPNSSMYLETIKNSGRDLISIVNSRISLNKWADIAIADRRYAVHTIDELEKRLENEMLKGISGDTRYRTSVFFNHELPQDCDSFRIDLDLLRDSVLPLVINAIQNTPDGIVLITTTIRPDCKQLIVDVQDTGIGIPSDHQQRIFEPYEKVSMHSTGAGLGLTLASKFATLLQGSVVLMSSDSGRGSYFRATFREVECICSLFPRQPLALKLKNLPSKFHHLASSSDGVLLCDYFIKFLTYNGFTSTSSVENCFAIVDFVPDLEQCRRHLSQISVEQVAICLIPASAGKGCFRQTPNNVVFVSAPFSTSKMSLALEEADSLLSKVQATRSRLLQPDEPSLTLPRVDEGLSAGEGSITDLEPWSMVDSSLSKERPAQLPVYNQVSPDSDTIVPSTNQPHPAASEEPRVFIPVSTNFTNVLRPRALLVDDNIINLRIMQMYCSKRGMPYSCATDGRQAIEAFSLHQSLVAAGEGDAIQLILMDLQMPVCDGIEATRQIRLLENQNQWKESILFIVTGQDSPTDRLSAETAGADEYFVKPVGIKLLDRVVKRYFPAFDGG